MNKQNQAAPQASAPIGDKNSFTVVNTSKDQNNEIYNKKAGNGYLILMLILITAISILVGYGCSKIKFPELDDDDSSYIEDEEDEEEAITSDNCYNIVDALQNYTVEQGYEAYIACYQGPDDTPPEAQSIYSSYTELSELINEELNSSYLDADRANELFDIQRDITEIYKNY